jgi:uncharacterized protein
LTGEAVLIAAFSGRSLAQSARRAGYRPFVVDAFGDLDTREAAEDVRVIESAAKTGFTTKPVVAALDELARAAASPIGLVLGSGFEDKIRLVSALAARFRLLGAPPEIMRACKEPAAFFATLDDLGVDHPTTQVDAPADATGWLSKRIGGSGGRHIRDCGQRPTSRSRRYFQQRLEGIRYSVSGIFSAGDTAPKSRLILSRQWISPSRTQPYRFGGCVSHPDVDETLAAQLTAIATSVASTLNAAGLASCDFIVSDAKPYLLELNPRPGASLDILDDDSGSMFRDHIAITTGGAPPAISKPSGQARAIAILHADRGAITLGDVPWPDWSADRGAPHTFVPGGAPLASAVAAADTADAAEALVRERLAELEDLIYGHAQS